MLFATNTIDNVRSMMGFGKFYLFRNNLRASMSPDDNQIYVVSAVFNGQVRELCRFPLDTWNENIVIPQSRLRQSDTRPKLFFLYLYMRRNNLLEKMKALFIEMGVAPTADSLKFA
jgi:hypothetical protein